VKREPLEEIGELDSRRRAEVADIEANCQEPKNIIDGLSKPNWRLLRNTIVEFVSFFREVFQAKIGYHLLRKIFRVRSHRKKTSVTNVLRK